MYVDSIPPFSPNGGTPDEGLRVIKDNGSPASVFDFTHHDVDRNPVWSPDGATIVFSSTRDHTQNKNLDIYSRVYEATTTEKLLVDNPADDWDPAWSAGRQQDRVRVRSATATTSCSRCGRTATARWR